MPASNPTQWTLAEARDALRAKRLSARELAEAHIAAMTAGRSLNAFITECPERALEGAARSDIKLAKGEGGALEGLPLAIKDLFCIKDVRTTAEIGRAHV